MSEEQPMNTHGIQATLERIEYELKGLIILHSMIVDALRMIAYSGGRSITGEEITKRVHDVHQEVLDIIRQSEQTRP